MNPSKPDFLPHEHAFYPRLKGYIANLSMLLESPADPDILQGALDESVLILGELQTMPATERHLYTADVRMISQLLDTLATRVSEEIEATATTLQQNAQGQRANQAYRQHQREG